jgi:hypothetical protein
VENKNMKFISGPNSVTKYTPGVLSPIDGAECHINNLGQLHRDDGPAVICTDGSKYWYKDGLQHREGGPAVTWQPHGSQLWIVEGKRHRLDGPAEHFGDSGTKKWYIEDREINDKAPQKLKWQMLKGDIESFQAFAGTMTKEMQEYVIENYILPKRPDLISLITNLHPDLQAKYQHEFQLSKVDL